MTGDAGSSHATFADAFPEDLLLVQKGPPRRVAPSTVALALANMAAAGRLPSEGREARTRCLVWSVPGRGAGILERLRAMAREGRAAITADDVDDRGPRTALTLADVSVLIRPAPGDADVPAITPMGAGSVPRPEILPCGDVQGTREDLGDRFSVIGGGAAWRRAERAFRDLAGLARLDAVALDVEPMSARGWYDVHTCDARGAGRPWNDGADPHPAMTAIGERLLASLLPWNGPVAGLGPDIMVTRRIDLVPGASATMRAVEAARDHAAGLREALAATGADAATLALVDVLAEAGRARSRRRRRR